MTLINTFNTEKPFPIPKHHLLLTLGNQSECYLRHDNRSCHARHLSTPIVVASASKDEAYLRLSDCARSRRKVPSRVALECPEADDIRVNNKEQSGDWET
jgi:hypothetical protein